MRGLSGVLCQERPVCTRLRVVRPVTCLSAHCLLCRRLLPTSTSGRFWPHVCDIMDALVGTGSCDETGRSGSVQLVGARLDWTARGIAGARKISGRAWLIERTHGRCVPRLTIYLT